MVERPEACVVTQESAPDAGERHHRVPGEVDVDVVEVVLAGFLGHGQRSRSDRGAGAPM